MRNAAVATAALATLGGATYFFVRKNRIQKIRFGNGK